MRALSRRLPDAVLAAGVIFTLYLQTLIPAPVFAVGDAGVKFLQVRQFASGRFHTDLRLPVEDWVEALWREGGLYPFEPPLVYRDGGRYVPTYSPFFALLTAPPYLLLGWRGLYLMPLLGTWAAWIALRQACRAYRVPPVAGAAALFALIFASPLTYYSATFWEHTPAVALAFAGLVLLWAQPFGSAPDRARAFAGGALIGSAAWFREETLVIVGLLSGLALLQRRVRWRLLAPLGAPAVAGLLAPCLLLVAVNTALYGVPLGAYSRFVLQPMPWRQAWGSGLSALRQLLAQLVAYCPPVALCLVAAPLLAVSRRMRERSDGRRSATILALCATYAVAVAFAARNPGGRQWGPRFLLVAVPLLCLVLGLALAAAQRRGGAWQWAAWLTFGGLAALGAHTNTWQAAATLRHNYEGRLVPYRFVQESGFRYVAVSRDTVAQQLAGAFEGRTFFLARTGRDLRRLAVELALRGERRFLYLCYAHYGCGPFKNKKAPPYPARRSLVAPDGRVQLVLINRGMLDRYAVFEAVVPRSPPAVRNAAGDR